MCSGAWAYAISSYHKYIGYMLGLFWLHVRSLLEHVLWRLGIRDLLLSRIQIRFWFWFRFRFRFRVWTDGIRDLLLSHIQILMWAPRYIYYLFITWLLHVYCRIEPVCSWLFENFQKKKSTSHFGATPAWMLFTEPFPSRLPSAAAASCKNSQKSVYSAYIELNNIQDSVNFWEFSPLLVKAAGRVVSELAKMLESQLIVPFLY